MRIAVSAGHGLHIRGAEGPAPWGLDEYDENVRVGKRVVADLNSIAGISAEFYTDMVSTTQDENLSRLVAWHNNDAFEGVGGDDRIDVSIHFNAAEPTTTTPRGTEVFYLTQDDLAGEISAAIAAAGGLKDRGAKYSDGLYFLRHTDAPAVLIEVCFCDSKPDCELYDANFDVICQAIANAIADIEDGEDQPQRPPPTEPPEEALFYARGSCSWFGGPDDDGVSASEGLAFLDHLDDARHLFLETQPAGTTGLARRLDPRTLYGACRWSYESTPKSMLANHLLRAKVKNPSNGNELFVYPADWGPHEDTGRVADLSPMCMELLDLDTDDEVEITYPCSAEP